MRMVFVGPPRRYMTCRRDGVTGVAIADGRES